MKSFQLVSSGMLASAALVFLVLPGARGAATNGVPAASKTNAVALVTNSGPAELPIPVSSFELAAKPTKDPFFPLSVRSPVPAVTNAVLALSANSFNLKGLSGSTDRRLALINNRTVSVGEITEITLASGKIKIHCLEIKENSVIIRAETQADPLEIFLRKTAQ